MSESEGFILKAEQFNQEEWCEMFIRVSENCKDLRVENECLQNQLKQKENIIKEVREYIMSELITDWILKMMDMLVVVIYQYMQLHQY